MEIFDDIHREGNTIVMVTHEEYIAEHAQRILNMHDGKIVEDYASPKPA